MGVLLDSEKTLFVHIPKNGGNTVSSYMQPLVSHGDMVVMEGPPDPRWVADTVSLDKHAEAWRWRVWFDETGRDWDEYKTFAVIRDPMLRPQSVWWEIRRSEGVWARKEAGEEWWAEFAACKNVEEFVQSGLYRPGHIHILRSQWEAVTYAGEVILDHLLLLETLWWQLPQLLATKHSLDWKHPGQYVPVELSREARAKVIAAYREDFDLYAHLKEESSQ